MKFFRILSSFFICGSGQILKREYVRGLFLLIGFLGSLALVFFGVQCPGFLSLLLVLAGSLFALFLWVYSIIDLCGNNQIKKKKIKILDKYDRIYLRGVSLYLKGQYDGAIKMFKLILKKNKNDAEVFYQLSKAYEKKGNRKLAKKMLKRYKLFHEVRV